MTTVEYQLAPRHLAIRETGNGRIFGHLGFTVVSESVATSFVSDAFPTLHEIYMERCCD